MVRFNGDLNPHQPSPSPFKQLIVVTPEGSLDHVLGAIRRRIDRDMRVKKIEPFHWEDGGWAIHLRTPRKLTVSDVEGVERSITIR